MMILLNLGRPPGSVQNRTGESARAWSGNYVPKVGKGLPLILLIVLVIVFTILAGKSRKIA